jgi:proteasome assembly chaperone 4
MSLRIESRFLPPSSNDVPALAVQIICMTNSYMIWIGATSQENVESAVQAGRLAMDWACAMPPLAVCLLFLA